MPLNKLPTWKCAVALLGCSISAAQTFAQETKPQQRQPEDVIRVFTDVVQTDVMVFDKQGRFVNGLKREDFQLRIDGKPQPIEFFDRIAAGSASEEKQLSAARGTAPNNASAPVPLDRGRTIFLYVDDFHISAGDLGFLRKALNKFIEDDLGQNDEMVVASASGQVGFLQQLTDNKVVLRAAVKRLNARPQNTARDTDRPPMNEYQAMVIDRSPAAMGGRNYHDLESWFVDRKCEEIQDCSPRGREVAEVQVRDRARMILEQAAAITTNTLDVFGSLVRSSTLLPGRKLVFFISDGFVLDLRNSDAAERLDQIIKAAATNGVVIYSMDSRALATGAPTPGDDVAIDMSGIVDREAKNEFNALRDVMVVLANRTGGRTIFDTNVLEKGLAKAVTETSTYYLLAWRADHEAQTSRKAPRIEVSLIGRPDLTVRVRQGFASAEPAKKSRLANAKEPTEIAKPSGAELRAALTGLYPTKDLPVGLDLQYQNTQDKGTLLTASTQIPIDSLSIATEDGKERAQVDVAGLVYNDLGKVVGHFNQRGTLTPAASNQVRGRDEAFTFKYHLPLAPGLYQVRAGVRDERNGNAGTDHQWIEIPDLSNHKLMLSSVIAGEISTAKNGQDQVSRMILRANHRFHRDASLRFQVYVYLASLAPAGSTPDLVMQMQLLRDRQPVVTTPLQEVPTTGLKAMDQIPLGADVPLERLAPGRYLLLVTVIDRVAKTSASQEMRFEVE